MTRGHEGDTLFALMYKLRKGRRIDPRRLVPGGPVKVNIGSSLLVAPGWTNVDCNLAEYIAMLPAPLLAQVYRRSEASATMPLEEYTRRLKTHRFVHHDISESLPFRDDTVDFVFNSHVLEHLFEGRGRRFLQEIHRVLRPGGLVRVVVPDLPTVIALYPADRERFLGLFFAPEDASSYGRHRYMYDFGSLRALLEATGFRDVKRWGYQKGETPDLHILDANPDISLYVEARK